MALPTFQEVWSRYLFDQASPIKGDDLLDESRIRDNQMLLDNGVALLQTNNNRLGCYYRGRCFILFSWR